MVYDDIIVGSGLTALATAFGLAERRRVLVLAGPAVRRTDPYDETSGIPCASFGVGGLGSFWHGVIPFGPSHLEGVDPDVQRRLFRLFYPRERTERFAQPVPPATWLFVPYKPIRPERHWSRLTSSRPATILKAVMAHSIRRDAGTWSVATSAGVERAHRVWMAAGALGTPAVFAASPDLHAVVRSSASDHVILYLGQIDRRVYPSVGPPTVVRGTHGTWLAARRADQAAALLVVKPARFDYATLDAGIEQRAAFGLPTGGVLAKLARAGSPGLVAESLYNKFGLFPSSPMLSAYAQLRIADAYGFAPGEPGLRPRGDVIQPAMDSFRDSLAWPELVASRRRTLFVRGIHLHGTLDAARLRETPAADRAAGLTIVDASAIDDIGAEHHTFATMTRAFDLAQREA